MSLRTVERRRGRALSRRAFLHGVKGATLALPFLSSLWPAESDAGGGGGVGLFTIVQGCGVAQSLWWPESAPGTLTAASFGSGHSFESLGPMADRLLFVGGLDNVPHLGGCDHHRVIASLLSAQPHRDGSAGNAGGSDSIDALIAMTWDPAGRPPLVLLGGRPNNSLYSTGTHVAGEPIVGTQSPAQALGLIANLFPSQEGQAELAAARARGQSVLDFVNGELCGIRQHRLSAADRRKLDAYTEALRGVEQDLIESGGANCQAPTTDYSLYDGVPIEPADVASYAEMLVDIGVLAAACGYRRAITFYMGGEAPGTNYAFLGASCDHHGLSHHTCDGDAGGPFDADSDAVMHAIDTWHVDSLFRRAVEGLAAYDGPNGDLLSDFGVLLINGLSDGRTHSHRSIPIVLAGGMGGYFRQGAYVDVSNDGSIQGAGICDVDVCHPHNRFLNMLAEATGIESAHFGSPDLPGGDHAALRA
jgi:hypothetical protein